VSEERARRAGRRAELLEQAAEVSGAELRTRRERIIATARPILQSAVAAALAWLVATEVVGHEQPFFAPISALITLGLTVGERRRRAVEIAIGVAVGIARAPAPCSTDWPPHWRTSPRRRRTATPRPPKPRSPGSPRWTPATTR
jgi:Fusaric acid resistance protein-like